MTKITPTVGRMLHYVVVSTQPWFAGSPGDVCAAVVARVNSESNVTLTVFDAMGRPYPVEGVPLVQEGDTFPAGNYCRWMPFQVGQAAKTDDVAVKLAEQVDSIDATLARLLTTPILQVGLETISLIEALERGTAVG